MRIIGCCGAARAGKSTASDILCLNRWRNRHYSFANSLKEYCANTYYNDYKRHEFGWDENSETWTGNKTERGRLLLQTVSNEMRAKNPAFFIQNLLQVIKHDQDEINVAIIDDFRYINELDLLQSVRQPLLYIVDVFKEREWLRSYEKNEEWAIHISEVQWRLWTHVHSNYYYIIHNTEKDKTTLKMQLDRFAGYSEDFNTAPELFINNKLELEIK